MSQLSVGDFPFEEIRKDSGDYFDTAVQARSMTGYGVNHIWSVVQSDDCYCYGPSHHVVNVIGFIATAETHNGDTYYEEM